MAWGSNSFDMLASLTGQAQICTECYLRCSYENVGSCQGVSHLCEGFSVLGICQ